MRRKSKRCRRERIGAALCAIFCGSVVANTNTTRGGGSSRILSSAFHASRVSMWASSTMYTLWRPSAEAAYMARSRRSRASSTPRFEAASSSTTSRLAAPVHTRVQESHSPHGSPASPPAVPRRSQFNAIARMRAAVVFPTPRGPANRYPCATRPPATAPRRTAAMCSCTIRSEKRFGRYLRARAIMGGNLAEMRNSECGMRNAQ